MLYFLKCQKSGFHKIGFTYKDVAGRHKSANSRYNRNFDLVGTVEGSMKDEALFHKWLKNFRVSCERELFYIPSSLDINNLYIKSRNSIHFDPYLHLSFKDRQLVRIKTKNYQKPKYINRRQQAKRTRFLEDKIIPPFIAIATVVAIFTLVWLWARV